MRSNLFKSLQEESRLVLLFLNNVRKIKIEVVSADGKITLAELTRSVEADPSGLKRITITNHQDKETEVFMTSSSDLKILPDTDSKKDSLRQLSERLKVKSKVSVSALLAEAGDVPEELRGRVSVMLPLPQSQTTNTTLPVLVNGFFALSESRRDLKLETSDDHSDEVRDGGGILEQE